MQPPGHGHGQLYAMPQGCACAMSMGVDMIVGSGHDRRTVLPTNAIQLLPHAAQQPGYMTIQMQQDVSGGGGPVKKKARSGQPPHTRRHTQTHADTRRRTHTHAHARTHTHTHAHTRAHTHTFFLEPFFFAG